MEIGWWLQCWKFKSKSPRRVLPNLHLCRWFWWQAVCNEAFFSAASKAVVGGLEAGSPLAQEYATWEQHEGAALLPSHGGWKCRWTFFPPSKTSASTTSVTWGHYVLWNEYRKWNLRCSFVLSIFPGRNWSTLKQANYIDQHTTCRGIDTDLPELRLQKIFTQGKAQWMPLLH